MLGCTPQAYKAHPAPRPKKEPGVSSRDTNGVTDGGAYTSEAKSMCSGLQARQVANFILRERPGCPSQGELTSGGLLSYQGNQQKGRALTAPVPRTSTSWGLGQGPRKVGLRMGGCRGSRHWLSRGGTEGEWPTLSRGLTLQMQMECDPQG